jgi:hypothetical protein
MAEIEYDQSDSDTDSLSSFGFDLLGKGSKSQHQLDGSQEHGPDHAGESGSPGRVFMSDTNEVESSQNVLRVIRSRFSNLDDSQDLVVEITEGQAMVSDGENAPEPLFRWM